MYQEKFDGKVYGSGNESQKSIEAFNEEMARAQILLAEEALKSQHLKIGEGQTAEVHTVAFNDQNCLKIISTMQHHDTVEKTAELPQGPKYVTLKQEADFLELLHGIHDEVRTPAPRFTITRKMVKTEKDSVDQGEISILCMERLNAVSIRDVLRGEAKLPENFDEGTFFKKVVDFVEVMHGRGIHHRDLHDGNIMIDLSTGLPCVIDFGCSVRAFGDDDHEIYRDGNTVYIPDLQNVGKVQRLMVRHLTV